MSKLLIGILAGALLGAVDGATALIDGVKGDVMVGVIIGSTFKGLVGGLVAGFVALKTPKSAPILLAALVVAAAFSHWIGMTATTDGTPDGPKVPYLRIMLPGLAVGLITGYAVVRYGRPYAARPAA